MVGVRHDTFKANPDRIDPDVKIPEAVKRAGAAADKAQREAYSIPEPEPTPVEPPTDTIKLEEPPSPTPPPGVTTVVAEPAPPAPAESGTQDSWENRFKAENGRYLRTRGLLEQATGRITALEGMLGDLQTQQRAQPLAELPAPAPAPMRLITEQEEKDFGPEMLDVMRRITRETVSPELTRLQKLEQSTSDLASRLSGTSQEVNRTGRQNMMSALDAQVPNWREINDLAEFKGWLALPDPYFGAIRHHELLKVWEQNDTPRVLAFFKGFVSELAASNPTDPGPSPPPVLQPDKTALASLAAPGRARTPAAQQHQGEKQIITTADINAFYRDKAAGKYAGREALFAQLEQELFLAQREGRVRQV